MDASCAESSEKELIELSGLPLYLVDVVVGGAELVAVGSVGRGAGQFHLVAGSVRVHPVALLAANTNCESFVQSMILECVCFLHGKPLALRTRELKGSRCQLCFYVPSTPTVNVSSRSKSPCCQQTAHVTR